MGWHLAALILISSASWVAGADGTVPFTASSYMLGLPYPGDTMEFDLGNVQIRNRLVLFRVQSGDERLTGRRTILQQGLSQPDGSLTISGSWTGEVGNWSLIDPKNPTFSRTAGLWEGTWTGRQQPDGSSQIQLVGRGSGGAVAGLEIVETETRGPGAVDDPNVVVVHKGTIGLAGTLNAKVIDNFDDNKVTGWDPFAQDGGSVQLVETNKQFTINWRTVSQPGWHYAAGGGYRLWNVNPGKTLEWRVELVSLGQFANCSAMEIKQDDGHAYFFIKGRDFVMIFKWLAPDIIVFACAKTSLPSKNILLSGAMSRAGANLVLTLRLLDKANPQTVLQEINVTDTSRADASLNTAQVKALTGMVLDCPRDSSGAPYLDGDRYFLAVGQYTEGQVMPAAEATFDNLELWTHDIPLLSSEPAVRLRWPASAFPFRVEGAPTVNGPWLPVQEPVFESDGVKQLTAPTTDLMRLFRLK